MSDALCCSMYWLGLHNKNSNFMPELKQFGRAGKHWISSISTTPLHSLAIDHDVGRWGTYFDFFGNSSRLLPLTPSFPYLLFRHKIGLDLISGKDVNFKPSSPHIFSRMSHIWCLFTDMVPRRNCYLTKVVNLSTPSMQIWPKKSISTAWLRQRTFPKQRDLMRGSSY